MDTLQTLFCPWTLCEHEIIADLLLISLLHIIYNIVAFCQSVIYLTLLPPLDWYRKGVCFVSILSSFVISVMASIVAYYICKWLDGDK